MTKLQSSLDKSWGNVRPSTARIVDDWRAVPIDIIDNRSSGRSS